MDARLAERGGAIELLRLPAALFGAAVRARGALYDRGLLPVQRLELPVVSVGNLSTGGTGKTPMVVWVAAQLGARDLRPGILARGYRSGGARLNDEGRELAERLPDVPQVQDPDRARGGERLVALGIDVVLLDDGFQHRRLARDLDLVLVDATRPWGLGPPLGGGEVLRALLPRGLLREPPESLARADALVVTRSDEVGPEQLAALVAELERLAPGVPLATARHGAARLVSAAGDELPLADLRGRTVVLASGLGNPEGFERSVRALGAEVVEHRALPDHHAWTAGDLAGLADVPLVTTHKDAVKLRGHSPGLLVLETRIEIVEGERELAALLDALPESCARRRRGALRGGLVG